MTTPLATRAEVDLSALTHNYRALRQLAPPSVKLLAVVKADAYGHGAIPVATRLQLLGADLFGVARCSEGVELRRGGITRPIVVLSGVYQEEAEEVLQYNLTPMIYRMEEAEALSVQAGKWGKRLPVHIKVDTGMGRIGLLPEEVPPFADRLRRLPHLQIEGIASHLSTADEEDPSFSQQQIDRFNWVIEMLRRIDIVPPYRHIANSAALVKLPSAHFNLVRPGIMLYGSYPSPTLKGVVALRQVMSWKSRIADIRRLPKGHPVSYGRTFVAQRPSLIAAVPVGYADGYHRLLSNRGAVLIRGKRAPVVGRVCMDWTMVDVTEIEGAAVGDEVVLLGGQGDEVITAEEMGGWIGTISYEILCSVGKRVERIYKG